MRLFLVFLLKISPHICFLNPIKFYGMTTSLNNYDNVPVEFDDTANNIYSPWSLEDDKILYNAHLNGESLEKLCELLKRGPNGIKARLNNIKNRDHKAYHRLFVKGDKSMHIEDDESTCETKNLLRPVSEVIERILWDPQLNSNDFYFVYKDRFNGLHEKPINSSNDQIKGKERSLVKAMPSHRIEQIKYKERVVWDKQQRLDYVFGTGQATISNVKNLQIESNNADRINIEYIISTYEEWYTSQTILKQQTQNQTYHIFCDLDGVLVDFDAGVSNIFKGRKPENISPKVMWSKLATMTPEFFTNLPWMDDGKVLWKYLMSQKNSTTINVNVSILTGLPRGNWAEPQKRKWCAKHLKAGNSESDVSVICCMSKNKCDYLIEANSILIDDREEAKEKWESVGGIFVWHENSRKTIQQLNQVLGLTDNIDTTYSYENNDAPYVDLTDMSFSYSDDYETDNISR